MLDRMLRDVRFCDLRDRRIGRGFLGIEISYYNVGEELVSHYLLDKGIAYFSIRGDDHA